jgi:hypothetical protein
MGLDEFLRNLVTVWDKELSLIESSGGNDGIVTIV